MSNTSIHKFTSDDQSEYLTHIVCKEDPYCTIRSILSSGTLEVRNAFGFKRGEHHKKTVCFNEIPLTYLDKLVN